MITKAITKDGRLFIPNVVLENHYSKQEVKIDFKIIETENDKDIFEKTAGLLKNKKINPLKFQIDQRSEWDG